MCGLPYGVVTIHGILWFLLHSELEFPEEWKKTVGNSLHDALIPTGCIDCGAFLSSDGMAQRRQHRQVPAVEAEIGADVFDWSKMEEQRVDEYETCRSSS